MGPPTRLVAPSRSARAGTLTESRHPLTFGRRPWASCRGQSRASSVCGGSARRSFSAAKAILSSPSDIIALMTKGAIHG